MSDDKKKPACTYRSFVETDDYLAETVVKKKGDALLPYFCRYDKTTGKITYVEEVKPDGSLLPIRPMRGNEGLIGFVNFPSSAEEYGSDGELMDDIRAFIRKWVDLDEKYEKLAALYVMFTYAYDEFMEVPYLRILADLGSGKSRLGVHVLGRICYKAFSTVAASTLSPLFRSLDFTRGTMVLDESDLGDRSDKTSELVQMLNSGYMKGVPMMRSERSAGGFRSAQYRTFGPKIIISREHFKDAALESRCLEVRLTQTDRNDIPLMVNPTIDEDAEILRGKLLLWRLKGYGERAANVDESFAKLDVPPRVRQLLLIMSGTTSDPSIRDMLREMGRTLSKEQAERRSESIEGDIVEHLALKGAGNFVSCHEISEVINEELPPAMKKSPRSVGWYMRERLGLVTERSDAGQGRGIRIDEDTLEKLKAKYGATGTRSVGEPEGLAGTRHIPFGEQGEADGLGA